MIVLLGEISYAVYLVHYGIMLGFAYVRPYAPGIPDPAMYGLFWLVVLSRLPLSTAYPFVALSYLIILGFSTIVLHERPPLLTWGGAGLIMMGIVMIGAGGFDRGT